ncbi:MAG: 30S ribosomal protein S19e [archaeon]|nr:30S ribosomal protein S19e [archaeon]MCR4323369.1 30S ribosomal protein S19e [Nanoarchaeota archaeon]
MARLIFAKDPVKYIPAIAEALKKIPEFGTPEWAKYVKSGTSKERPPANDDFWFTRAASILRQLYIQGVVGVGRLRTRYGSRKDRGGRPDSFRKAGGKIIRSILQQAEAAGLVEKVAKKQHGRKLTQKGRDFLDSIDVEEKVGLKIENLKINQLPSIGTEDNGEIEENYDEESVEEEDGRE